VWGVVGCNFRAGPFVVWNSERGLQRSIIFVAASA
jgi:hypothetical protein